MKATFYIVILIIFAACGTSSNDKKVTDIDSSKINSIRISNTTDTTLLYLIEDTSNYSIDTFFVVVADTSQEYYLLHKKMFELNRKLKIPIDTMGRYYNKSKQLIALPDDDEDEIYAGDYYPRRFPSEYLSLEYLNYYKKPAGEKTIALVTGIYELEKSADSALIVLSKKEKKAFKIKADIYVGCMH